MARHERDTSTTVLTSSSAACERFSATRARDTRFIETVPRRGYRFVEPVTARSETHPANTLHRWTRRLVRYAAVALLAAIAAILFARTRYDKVVPSQRSQTAPKASGVPR